MRFALPLLVLAAASGAQAQTAPSQRLVLDSATFVAREVTDAQGKKKNQLFPAKRVVPGDRVVFVLSFSNPSDKPNAAVVIDNPIPAQVSFTGAREAWASVSVDGGKSFGPLATLKVKGADGKLRGAIPQDVTHVRWKLAQSLAPKAKGDVAFYAVVK